MKFLFTGNYDVNYNRTVILIRGLEALGHTVIDFPFTKRSSDKRIMIRELSADADVVYLPSFTHPDVKFVKKSIRKKKLIFDPLISRYLTKVFDYKQVSRFSPRAYKNYLKDKIAFRYADLILADTEAHKQYFVEKFGVDKEKIKVLPICVNPEEFYPRDEPDKDHAVFTVGFYGGFIPLQGTRYILQAAALLKDIPDVRFVLAGDGFEYAEMKKLAAQLELKNVVFLGWLPHDQLNDRINTFDVCLGIFGDSLKADLVIPNKFYHYAACRKAIITKDTPAIRELAVGGQDAFLLPSDPGEIAAAILELKNDVAKRVKLAEHVYQKVVTKYNHLVAAQLLADYAKDLV
jgi:glycosyltransferase involved in cell wall biosynthesis